MKHSPHSFRSASLSLLGALCVLGVAGFLNLGHGHSTSGLIFRDEFNGSQLGATWSTCFPWVRTKGCTHHGNQELEWYRANNVSVSQGLLHLQAERATFHAPNGKTYPFTSGMVSSGGRSGLAAGFSYRYGYTEIRARLPRGVALWSAFWQLPTDGSWPPEIDGMEAWGGHPRTLNLSARWAKSSNGVGLTTSKYAGNDFTAGWHRYGVDWQPDAVTWYVDGRIRKVWSDTENIPTTPMYLLVTLAIDGSQGGPKETTSFPRNLAIDYLRVWKKVPFDPSRPQGA